MTTDEARQFLTDFNNTLSESNYLARYSTSKPLAVTNPDLFDKKIEAEAVLGILKWQKSYEDVKRIHPLISIEKYNKYRVKHGL
jgi:hypothetical protein